MLFLLDGFFRYILPSRWQRNSLMHTGCSYIFGR